MSTHCLLLTSEYPPLVLGGVGRYVHEVAQRLNQRMRVSVALVPTYAAPTVGAMTDRLALEHRAGPPVWTADLGYRQALLETPTARDRRRLVQAAETIAVALAAQWRADEELVIYVQDYALAPVAAALLARAPRALLLAACHLPVFAGFTYFDKPVSDEIHQVLEAGLVNLAHRVVVPSAFAAHALNITHNLAHGKLVVLPLGVARPGSPEPMPSGPLRLLAVGRATEQKGYHFLFEALRRLAQDHAGVRLSLVAGSDTARLQELARRHGVEALVAFSAPQGHDAIWRLYDSHQVLVSTSLYETFGLAVLEAMASGRPSIGFSVGALPELWGAALAPLLGTPVADVDALVVRLAALAASPQRLRELGPAVSARAADFSWERHVQGLLELMETSATTERPRSVCR